MTCLDEDTALALVAGEVADRDEIDAHLDQCTWCRQLVAEISDGVDEPDRIGKFVIQRELGAGATGVVYAARDPELDREVALKLLHRREDDALVAEARLMAKLAHPNVVPVYEVGRHEDAVFVAMELVAGGTLRTWLAGKHTRAEIVATICGAGHGLAAAHELGLVHRDVKPENILVGRDGRARVSDFGLSATAVEAARVGTPAYMAPEQLRGELVDARSDQFAFCVVLYEALYGERPFTGTTIPEQLAAIARGPKQRGLRAIVRGLAADPAQRFPSMRALLARLERKSTVLRVGAAVVTLALIATLLLVLRHEDSCPDVSITHPNASSGLAQVELDRYAAAWAIAHHDACTATKNHQASDVLLDQRMRCLEDRRIAYNTLIEFLADPAYATKATSAIGALQAPATCLDPDNSDDPLAFAPNQQADAAQLRDHLARAEAAVALGRKPELSSVLARADELHLPRLRANALYLRAEAHMAAREDTDAVADLEDASLLAEANHLDRLAARADSLAVAAATDAADFPAAHRWARSAEAALARAGDRPDDKAALASRIAWLDLHEAKLAHAETEALAAIADGCRGEVAAVASCAHFDTLASGLFRAGQVRRRADLLPEEPRVDRSATRPGSSARRRRGGARR
ncbi:MAG: serine/threonine-protein kinase [Kofleriaceae bacterium]